MCAEYAHGVNTLIVFLKKWRLRVFLVMLEKPEFSLHPTAKITIGLCFGKYLFILPVLTNTLQSDKILKTVIKKQNAFIVYVSLHYADNAVCFNSQNIRSDDQ